MTAGGPMDKDMAQAGLTEAPQAGAGYAENFRLRGAYLASPNTKTAPRQCSLRARLIYLTSRLATGEARALPPSPHSSPQWEREHRSSW